MTFATALALLVGLLVGAPVIAHLLRRGKTQEFDFPPAHLVPKVVVTSEQRRRIEDRALLFIRGLMVLTLAVLGATPFVRCSRLSVERESGASVALAIVVDDSQSMRAITDNGETRFKAAKTGAQQLLNSAREGDAVAIILASKPARVALSPTTELSAAEKILNKLKATDRGTALGDAIQLARSSLKELPHTDRRVVVLSDLSASALPSGEPPIWTPLPALAEPIANCGIASAERQGLSIVASIGCNDTRAIGNRELELFVYDEPDSQALGKASLDSVPGQQKLAIEHEDVGLELGVRLTGKDAIPSDNVAPVAREITTEVIAVIADPSKASTITGGPTVVEQALSALFPATKIKPLATIPEAAEDFAEFSAIVIDDPPGLSPEARTALNEWLDRGGVALGLLGPTSTTAQLAASLDPFARKGAEWEEKVTATIDPSSVSWLGESAKSLESLGRGGRLRLDGVDLPDTKIVGRWSDGVPWLFRRKVGHGLVFTVGLSASVELSDFALRPGFLALLDQMVMEARSRSGPRRSDAGALWKFPDGAKLSATGPDGEALAVQRTNTDGDVAQVLTPDFAGRYELQVGDAKSYRIVGLDVEELTKTPLDVQNTEAVARAGTQDNNVDISPEWALLVLALFAAELVLRSLKARNTRTTSVPA